MGQPDELGIYAPSDNDPSDPSGDMRLMRGSLKGHIFAAVANIADRDALALEVGPTSDAPLVVFREDAGPGQELEWTFDGTTWLPDKRPFYCRSTATRSDGQLVINNGSTDLRVDPVAPLASGGSGWTYLFGGSGLANPRPGLYQVTADILVTFAGATWCSVGPVSTQSGTVITQSAGSEYQAAGGFGRVSWSGVLWCPNGLGVRFGTTANAAGVIRSGSTISAVRLGDY